MKIAIESVTTGPDILAMFQNPSHDITIIVHDDISYEVIRNGHRQKTDMSKWYVKPSSVITHIENDVAAGYYPGVRRIA